jgi:hypothetical protein
MLCACMCVHASECLPVSVRVWCLFGLHFPLSGRSEHVGAPAPTALHFLPTSLHAVSCDVPYTFGPAQQGVCSLAAYLSYVFLCPRALCLFGGPLVLLLQLQCGCQLVLCWFVPQH